MNEIENIIQEIKNKDSIYLYGAGVVARRCYKLFDDYGLNVCGFFVSEQGDNPDQLFGKPVLSFGEIVGNSSEYEQSTLFYAIKTDKILALDKVANINFGQVIFPSNLFYNKVRVQIWMKLFNEHQNMYNLVVPQYCGENNMYLLKKKNTDEVFFRVFESGGMIEDFNFLNTDEFCDLFEEQFGKLNIFCDRKRTNDCKLNISLFVATSHLDKMNVREDTTLKSYEKPIQVGAALTDIRKGCITDNTGDNISIENANYCECTGLYWAWKNTDDCDYVGLEHYRRRLKLPEKIDGYLMENDIDVILALPQYVMKKPIDFFVNVHVSGLDWKLMKEFITEYDSSYHDIVERYEESLFYFSCNLCLFKKTWFDRYCEFAFSVSKKIDQFYKDKNIIRQDRYMGYIFENLLSMFMMKHYDEMNVVCTEVEWVE